MNLIANNQSFSVLDLLGVLSRAKNVKVLTDCPEFQYEPAQERVPAEDAPRFVAYASTGVPISSLTYNVSRASVSFLVVQNGHVTLERPGWADLTVRTSKIRNYHVIRDGVCTLKQIPIVCSDDVKDILHAMGVPFTDALSGDSIQSTAAYTVIDLSKLPLVDTRRFSTVSAKAYLRKQYELLEIQAALKVFKALLPPKDAQRKPLAIVYGEDIAKRLADIGLTEAGYNPKTKLVKRNGPIAKVQEIRCSIKGIAGGAGDFPTIQEARAKIAKTLGANKLPLPMQLMRYGFMMCDAFMRGDAYQNPLVIGKRTPEAVEDARAALLAFWAQQQIESADVERLCLQSELAQDTFALLMGVGFNDYIWGEELTLETEPGGKTISARINKKDVRADA
jgi:hypothetical protein